WSPRPTCTPTRRPARDLAPHAPGVAVVVVRAADGDVAALAAYSPPGTTLVLLGASGVGKSTVVNALAGGEVMPTGDVRHVDGKGRHTTTHRELVVLPSGAVVIDTPGLRGVALAGSQEGLALAFSDVEELAAACRFADCAHVGEPGCAVQASLEVGDLTADRIASWRKLQRELAFQARRTDHRLRAEERARWKAVTRSNRDRPTRT
ncbi:MAG: GTPase RsgA, partial [Frankiaceae bacterium]|nr:GTPase RsgA [Frankiaceae bacterium]